MTVKHNYLVIGLLLLFHMIFGFVWYGIIFGETWSLAAYGKTPEQMQQEGMGGSPMPYVVNLAGVICICLFLSWLVQRLNYNSFSDGLKLGIYASIGLVFPVISTHYMFLPLNATVLMIDLAMSAILVTITAGVLSSFRK